MKKTTTILFACAYSLICLFNSNNATAQANPNHIYHVGTWYMIPGLDSAARAQRDVYLKEYLTKVTMKNEFIIHQWTMGHFYTEDSRELVTITEYASWGDMEKAADKDDELAKQAWPDAQKRADFMKKMGSYYTHHKDAIFSGLTGM